MGLIPVKQALQQFKYPKLQMLVLSHSTITSFRSCARKLEHRQFYGVAPRNKEDNYAGDVGNAIHSGFGTWLISDNETDAIIEFGMHFPYEEEFLKPGQQARNLEASYGSLMALINHGMLRQHRVVKINTVNGEKFGVEIPFAIHITGAPFPIPVYYVGKIDVILYDEIKDRFIVTDLKTTRQELDDPTPKYQYDEQATPYGIILELLLNRTITEFDVVYLECYVDLINPKIRMLEFHRSVEDVIDWKRGLFEDIERIARYYDKQWFPRVVKGDSCLAYNRPCQFHDICYIREPETLGKIMDGEIRTKLFSTGEEPWIVAELPYERF